MLKRRQWSLVEQAWVVSVPRTHRHWNPAWMIIFITCAMCPYRISKFQRVLNLCNACQGRFFEFCLTWQVKTLTHVILNKSVIFLICISPRIHIIYLVWYISMKVNSYIIKPIYLEYVPHFITSGGIHAYVPAADIRVVLYTSRASPKSVIFNVLFCKLSPSIAS